MSRIVAGFDLSFTRSAVVVLTDEFTVYYSSAKPIAPGPSRLKRAFHQFYYWTNVFHDIKLAVIEDNAYGAPSRSVVVKLSQLNTLVKTVCECEGIDWLEVSPSALKKEITGKGTAEKHQVATQLEKLYGIKFENDKGFDLSDAACAAVWGVKHLQRGR